MFSKITLAVLMYKVNWAAALDSSEINTADVVSDMQSIMFERIATCAGIEFDPQSCVETSILEMFSEPQPNTEVMRFRRRLGDELHEDHYHDSTGESDECGRPSIGEVEIQDMMSKTAEICMINSVELKQDEIKNAVEKFTSFFSEEQCWEDVCSDEGGMWIVSSWLETCVGVDLPYSDPYSFPTGDEYDMTFNYIPDEALDIEKKDKVTCMLDYVMSSSPANFGLEEPTEGSIDTCFPPGHYDMEKNCLSNIGPDALEYCGGSNMHDSAPQFPFGSEMITPDMSYSYHGEFSFSYGYDLSFSYDYNLDDDIVDDDLTTDEKYIVDLCYILESLSSEKGKGCLTALCDLGENESDDPETKFPSASPSTKPDISNNNLTSVSPSSPHSILPSVTPSALHGAWPSASPSATPNVAFTNAPSLAVDESTGTPTASPTTLAKNGTVEITFAASLTLNNFNASDVPLPGPELDAMVKVLEKVISDFLPTGALAKILRIGGISVARRLLRQLEEQESVDIEFEVKMKRECQTSECADADQISNDMYEDVVGDFSDAVSSGSLTTSIQEEASGQGVTILQTVSAKPSSFKAGEPKVKVTKGDGDSGGGGGISSSSPHSQKTSICIPLAFLLSWSYLNM